MASLLATVGGNNPDLPSTSKLMQQGCDSVGNTRRPQVPLMWEAAYLAHDAVAEQLQGHVSDGPVGPRLDFGLDAKVPRQAKVGNLGPEAVRRAVATRQQHIACTAKVTWLADHEVRVIDLSSRSQHSRF